MKSYLLILLVLPLMAWALPPTMGELPPVTHADGVVSTNLPLAAALSKSGSLAFCLNFTTSPSNNVEVAFGHAAMPEALADEEVDLVVGWDCGTWFVRKGMESVAVSQAASGECGECTFSWRVRVDGRGVPRHVEAFADGQPLFVDLPANGLFSRDWNAVRLTGRGREVEDGSFAARCRMDETVFIFR